MSTRELQHRLLESLREWQQLEDAQIVLTDRVLERTGNQFVAVIMEIIRRDCQMHYRVQQLLIDSLESAVVTIAPADVDCVQAQLAAHLELKQKTMGLAQAQLAALSGQRFLVQEYLFDFLRRSEQMHVDLLTALAAFRTPDSAGE